MNLIGTATLQPVDLQKHDGSHWIGSCALFSSLLINLLFLLLALNLKSMKNLPADINPVTFVVIQTVSVPSSPQSEASKNLPSPVPEIPKVEPKEIPNIIKHSPAPKLEKKKLVVEEKPATAPLPISPMQTSDSTNTETFGVVPGVEAEPIEQIKPEIPDSLKDHEYKAYVRLKVEVNVDGTSNPFLKTSSGNNEVDSRVLSAIRKWKWQPGMLNGKAVPSVRYFKFEFQVK